VKPPTHRAVLNARPVTSSGAHVVTYVCAVDCDSPLVWPLEIAAFAGLFAANCVLQWMIRR